MALLSCVTSLIGVLGDAVSGSSADSSALAPRLFHLAVTVEALTRSSNVKREANETLSRLAAAEVSLTWKQEDRSDKKKDFGAEISRHYFLKYIN